MAVAQLHPKIKWMSEEKVHVKALIYGEPGAGKTYLAATAPKPIMLVTEADVSKVTLLRVKRDLGVDVPVWDVQSLDDLAEAFEFLRSGQHGFETVVVDGLTDLNRTVVRGVIDDALQRKPTRDPDVPELGDYFKVGERVRSLMRAYRDLPMNVVFTALVTEVREEMMRVPLTIPKSLGRELAAYCNLVGYLAVVREGEHHVRKLLTAPTEGYVAKSPGGALPPVVDNPNLASLFKLIQEGEVLNGI